MCHRTVCMLKFQSVCSASPAINYDSMIRAGPTVCSAVRAGTNLCGTVRAGQTLCGTGQDGNFDVIFYGFRRYGNPHRFPTDFPTGWESVTVPGNFHALRRVPYIGPPTTVQVRTVSVLTFVAESTLRCNSSTHWAVYFFHHHSCTSSSSCDFCVAHIKLRCMRTASCEVPHRPTSYHTEWLPRMDSRSRHEWFWLSHTYRYWYMNNNSVPTVVTFFQWPQTNLPRNALLVHSRKGKLSRLSYHFYSDVRSQAHHPQ